MPSLNFTLIGVIKNYRLDDYIPHMGWISSSPTYFKIYRRETGSSYFLHDEQANKLYEFSNNDDQVLKDKAQFEEVIERFKKLGRGSGH
jgi:hypothetical protein